MPVGQQFSDWSSIDNSQPGVLGPLAAFAVDKSGLGNYLNTKLPNGLNFNGGKLNYTPGVAPPQATQSGIGIAPDFGNSYAQRQGVGEAPYQPDPTPTPIQANEQQVMPEPYHPNAAQALSINSWDGSEFGTSGADKMKMLSQLV